MNSMNETPRGERLHIGIFGTRNAGKSSLLNAITGQDSAVVSDISGTTTDPVYKAMELLPLGPVVLIDTPGIDDTGELGALRINKTKEILRKTDIAILVIDGQINISDYDKNLIKIFNETGIKYLTVHNKIDTYCRGDYQSPDNNNINVSAKTGENINELKNKIAELAAVSENQNRIIGDLLEANDMVILVIPIDSSAPKGRLILPQQQVIRDILDAGAVPVLIGVNGLSDVLNKLTPKLVITDSQVFNEVNKIVPPNIKLTSFSILMARYKGVLDDAVNGVKAIGALKNNDKVLIAEGCTHHRQCEDIGTVKIPRMLEKYTGINPEYEFSSGGGFPNELQEYKLIIHCGGCIQNQHEMRYRHTAAKEAGVPITNYGIAISYMQGILEKCIESFYSF
jgi:[FeFe] hydrogenase H-cluster maturation GTPase HydF